MRYVIKPPPSVKLVDLLKTMPDLFGMVLRDDVAPTIHHANDAYVHWDKFRWYSLPEGVDARAVWAYIKFRREFNLKNVPLVDKEGIPFSYWLPDSVLRILSNIDRWSGDTIGTEHPGDLPPRERYVISSLMEEAIASSQLEGAATTRQIAKEMLLSGRKPRDHNEQMIFNNWVTIQHLRANTKLALTPQSLCDIHAMITEDTLPDPADSGRVRTNDDVVVMFRDTVVHTPPPAKILQQRLEAFCEFANDDSGHAWIHPVVKASILHFWLGYDHFFVDGNGRTARAVFYWYLLSRNYWLFEYLSISRNFLRAPSQYARAYLYTETDERDLTYFIVYNLRVVQLAFQDLRQYLQRKQEELVIANDLLKKYRDLNERQRDIIAHALRHPGSVYTIQSHKNVNNIAYDTARNDLLDLVQRGLMTNNLTGRTYNFLVSPKIMEQLHKQGSSI